MKTKIYLASPFFNKKETKVYKQVIDFLRQEPTFEVFVPQEHEIEGGNDMANKVWGREVFNLDCQAIEECDIMVVLNWGMYSDSGTAWECGYAFAQGKRILNVLIEGNKKETSLMTAFGCDSVVTLKFLLSKKQTDIYKMLSNEFRTNQMKVK